MSFKRHRWTLGVFDDGSGVWLSEWHDEYVYRCHTPSRSKPTAWETDMCIEEHRGISKNQSHEVSRELAHEILNAWAKSRKNKNGGWTKL